MIRRITLCACAALLFALPLPAQTQPTTRGPGYKDPGIATLLSVVVTGGGQLYSGETTKGAALLGIGLGSLVVGAAASSPDNATPVLLGSLVYLGTWVYGIADASSSAQRMNARNGVAVGPFRAAPAVGAAPSGGTEVGVRLSF